MNIAIYGAGATGSEVLDILETLNLPGDNHVSFVVDGTATAAEFRGHPVFSLEQVAAFEKPPRIVVAIGEPEFRKVLAEKCKTHGLGLLDLVDSSAYRAESAQIGTGCVLYPGSVVSGNSRLGENTLVQFNSVVGHDISVGDHTVISSNVTLGGGVVIEERAFLGMGSTVKEGVRIGEGSVIGMGATVFKDVPPNLIALGNPARVVRRNESKRVFGGAAVG